MDVISFIKNVRNSIYNTFKISTNDRVIFLIQIFLMSVSFESIWKSVTQLIHLNETSDLLDVYPVIKSLKLMLVPMMMKLVLATNEWMAREFGLRINHLQFDNI